MTNEYKNDQCSTLWDDLSDIKKCVLGLSGCTFPAYNANLTCSVDDQVDVSQTTTSQNFTNATLDAT